jgi:2-(3-amino-3-carboxypropyl)histidine synthase
MGTVVSVSAHHDLYLPPNNCLTVPTTETTIKTLYVFVEISIDAAHLAQTIRLNFPTDRRQFNHLLLDAEDAASQIPVGQPIGPGQHLRIEGPEADSSAAATGSTTVNTAPSHEPTRLALVSTIQFVAALSRLKDDLTTESITHPAGAIENGAQENVIDLQLGRPKLFTGRYEATIPRSKPLSPGEILGCTAPQLTDDVDALV